MTREERTFRELISEDLSHETTEEVWQELARRVLLIARTATRGMPHIAAEDVAQAILVRLVGDAKLRSNLRSAEAPALFIARMARNTAIDSARRIRSYAQSTAEQMSEATEERELRFHKLETALSTLTADDLQMLRARFWEEKRLREIAAESGLSIAGVASRLFRIMSKLRKTIDLGE